MKIDCTVTNRIELKIQSNRDLVTPCRFNKASECINDDDDDAGDAPNEVLSRRKQIQLSA